ncbi:hypothetical protein EYE35_01305 [Cereibacter sphaeroides]|nr:hypothetical protein EYE35_01305 [Cereibacter sphaeroides]
MKRLFLSAVLALAAAAAVAAEPLTIATGKAGGGYDARAQQIAQRLYQRGTEAEVANLNGSDEISLAVCGGRADVGLMQIDAMYARSLEGCTMKPVAVYGTEYAFLLFPPRSSKDELSDLGASDAILVDTIGSGTDLFWRTIVKIENSDDGSKDAWASARAVNDPLELAQASAEMGDIAAVLLVRKPDSPHITRLLDLGWTLGEMWDRDINDLSFNGGSLYIAEKATVQFGKRRFRAWAYAVRSFIAVSSKVAAGDRTMFAAITGAAQ